MADLFRWKSARNWLEEAARYRRDDVDVGSGRDRRLERGARAGHVHVEMSSDHRPGVQQTIPNTRDLRIEGVDDLTHR